MKNNNQDLQILIQAFEKFKENTDRLQVAYNVLQQKVEKLNIQLEDRNKQLEESLQTIEYMNEFSNSILRNINSSVIAIDINGNIQTFNKRAEILFGMRSEDVLNKPYNSIFEFLPENFSLLHILNSKHDIYYNDVLFPLKEKKVPVEYSARLVLSKNGSLLGAVQIIRDMTTIKELEKTVQRQKTLAALGEMAAGVAHEIRNPLGGIEGFASLLKRRIKDEKNVALLNRIIDGVRNLNSIISNLLYYTRSMKLNLMPVDLHNLIEETINHIKVDNKVKSNSIEIKTNFSANSYYVEADPQKLKQVFFNLFYNSIQAIDEKNGMILVATKNDDKKIEIRIKDNGSGISDDIKEKIFNPFFTTKTTGTGLGLAITQKIIESHNGEIYVANSTQDGTEFVIKLPLIIK